MHVDVEPHANADSTVEAFGKLSDAFTTVEAARVHLRAFHRLTNSAEVSGEAADLLAAPAASARLN